MRVARSKKQNLSRALTNLPSLKGQKQIKNCEERLKKLLDKYSKDTIE